MESLTQVKERPILFNGEMVRAVLEGRKTQTRRVIKPKHNDMFSSAPRTISCHELDEGAGYGFYSESEHYACPYGKPGDQLWVRETFAYITDSFAISQGVVYKADGKDVFMGSRENLIPEGATVFNALSSEYPKTVKYSPSIHMPRWASRIQLEITDVRVERVQDISDEDVDAEGIYDSTGAHLTSCPLSGRTFYDYEPQCRCGEHYPHEDFSVLWNSIYEKQDLGWQVNPWVWVVEFKRITP